MISPNEIKEVFSLLEKEHQPTMLEVLKDYTPFQLLVATLLSSRTRDSTTIPLVKKLFKRWSKPEDFIGLNLEELEQALYGIGFYRVKAKHIKELSKVILKKYQRKVPAKIEELTSLPGIGRKTANCVLSYTFNKPAIAVDIHVHRISNRLEWINTKTAEETEKALEKIVPISLWRDINRLFVNHGQRICLPRKPRCQRCSIKNLCPIGKRSIS